MKPQPYPTTIPPASHIAAAHPAPDYSDAYAIRLAGAVPVERVPVAFFESMPAWFMAMLYFREMVAGWIGLKTAKGMEVRKQLREFQGLPGESIGLFHVLARSEQEILSGEDDKHLDFRLSFFAVPQNGETEIILATTVRFNGRLGRAYFLPVKPVHRLIVPVLLRRMVQRLSRS